MASKAQKAEEWNRSMKRADHTLGVSNTTKQKSRDFLRSRRPLTRREQLRPNPHVDFIINYSITKHNVPRWRAAAPGLVQSAVVVDTEALFEEMMWSLDGFPEICLDLEFGNRYGVLDRRPAVIQLGTPLNIFIIDTLAEGIMTLCKSYLRELLESKLLVVKGGRQDILSLHADFQIYPKVVVDIEEIHRRHFQTTAASFTDIIASWKVACLAGTDEDITEKKMFQAADWEARPLRGCPKKLAYLANDVYYVMIIFNVIKDKDKGTAKIINDLGYEPLKPLLCQDPKIPVPEYRLSHDWEYFMRKHGCRLGITDDVKEEIKPLYDYTWYLSKHFDAKPRKILSIVSMYRIVRNKNKIFSGDDLAYFAAPFERENCILQTKLRHEFYRVLCRGHSQMNHLYNLRCFRCDDLGHTLHLCSLARRPGETTAFGRKNPEDRYRRQQKVAQRLFKRAAERCQLPLSYRLKDRNRPIFRKGQHLYNDADRALNALRLDFGLTWQEVNEMGYFLSPVTEEQIKNQLHKKVDMSTSGYRYAYGANAQPDLKSTAPTSDPTINSSAKKPKNDRWRSDFENWIRHGASGMDSESWDD